MATMADYKVEIKIDKQFQKSLERAQENSANALGIEVDQLRERVRAHIENNLKAWQTGPLVSAINTPEHFIAVANCIPSRNPITGTHETVIAMPSAYMSPWHGLIVEGEQPTRIDDDQENVFTHRPVWEPAEIES